MLIDVAAAGFREGLAAVVALWCYGARSRFGVRVPGGAQGVFAIDLTERL